MGATTVSPDSTIDRTVAAAVARARAAQRRWVALPLRVRVRQMREVRRALIARTAEIMDVVHGETGKPPIEAYVHEPLVVANLVAYYERRAARLLASRRVGAGMLLTKRAIKHYEPYGIIGVISPWNFPFSLPAIPTVSALFGGNGVVLKPSEVAPASGRLVARIVWDALPEFRDLVQVVDGAGEAGAAVVRSSVEKIVFIGGTATGRKVLQAAAERLKPVLLELGGNDVAVVCDDADVERAAAGVVWGALANAGQCCIGIERALVAAPIHDRFVEAVQREVASLRVGSTGDVDVGRLIFGPQRDILDELVNDARARGATVWRPHEPADASVYPPTVLLNVTEEMRVHRDEAFGPLLSIVKVQDDADAVRIANSGPFGLSPSVWTRNRARGRRIALQLEAGSVTINDHMFNFAVPSLTHGGVKRSGFGRLHGDEGLMEFVRPKSLAETRIGLPREPIWFPYGPGRFDLLRRAGGFWLAPGVRAKLRALVARAPRS